MSITYTLGIIKPTAFQKGYSQAIIAEIQKAGFSIVAKKERILSLNEAKTLYAIHKERPFFESYCRYMSSGPVLVMKIGGENVVEGFRKLMGATDPKHAAPGTLRKKFGTDIEDNTIHGSDSLENACNELAFFFAK